MSNRIDNRWRTTGWLVVLVGLGLALPTESRAQFDFLKSLFGPRNAQQAVFRGQQQLSEARAAIDQGDIAKSIALARRAMETVTEPLPPNDPVAQSVSFQLLELTRLWAERDAPPADVADTLLEIVLPAAAKSEARWYAVPWQSTGRPWNGPSAYPRDPKPQNLATELMTWSQRAGQLAALQTRLAQKRQEQPNSPAVLGVAILLAATTGNDDAARTDLLALAPLMSQAADRAGLDPAWHVVSATLRRETTEAAALALLEAALDRRDALPVQPQSGGESNSAMLRLEAARRHFRAGRTAEGTRQALAAAAQPFADDRYDAQFAAVLQRMNVAEAAAVLLDGGRVTEALDLIGPLVDAPMTRNTLSYPGPNLAVRLGRELGRLPMPQRYELLKAWVLPQGERTNIRDLTDFVPGDRAPTMKDEVLVGSGLIGDVYSTGWDLVRTSLELGREAELREVAGRLDPQAASSQAFAAMIEVCSATRSGKASQIALATERLTALTATTLAGIPKTQDPQQGPFSTLTLAVALEAARSPQFDTVTPELLQRLIEHSQRLQWDRPRAHARLAWAEVLRRRQTPTASAAGNAGLPAVWNGLVPRGWTVAGLETASQHAGGSLPDLWLTHDDYVQHLTGPYNSCLFFQTPLAGEFELSFECREGAWSEGVTGYGGAFFAVNGYSDQAYLRGPGNLGYRPSPTLTNLLHKNPWNAQRIQVAGDVVRYFANGQLIHEDRPGAGSPWLVLGSDWGRTPIFRNLKLTGTPKIPREIPLFADARLRGWTAGYYGESQRDPLRDPPRNPDGDDVEELVTPDGQTVRYSLGPTDWQLRRGELQSPRREGFWPGEQASWITYHRPLCAGETVTFEVFHRRGETEAHPTIGRRIFELHPDGVTVQWLSDGNLDARGTTRDAGERRSQKVPLQENDWNRIELAMQPDAVELWLNGEKVLTQPLGPRDGRTFGVFHDAAHTSSRVRNAVLRGDWPGEFTEDLRAAIERPQPAVAPTSPRFATAIMSEPFFADNAYAVYRHALTLEPAARYAYLNHWVMPGPTHATLRMAGAMTPTHPAPPVLADNPVDAAAAEARQAVDGRLVQTGGSFVCPAILLILSAAELDRLDELTAALQKLDASSPAIARPQTALLGIIALLQDRPEEAQALIWESARLILETPPGEQSIRWSEPALCSLAMLHPVTREAAYELLDRIQRRQIQAGQPGSTEFSRYVRQLHGQLHYLLYGGDPQAFGTQPKLTQWKAAPQTAARHRGPGIPLAAFDALGGELALRGGHDFDMAYFQSPLRGNFELRCRLSQFDYREIAPCVAGICNTVKYEHKATKLFGIHGPITEPPTPQEISPRVRSWGDYRVVVHDGRYTCYVGDQVLYETEVGPNFDPWVAIAGWVGSSQRAARNVVITGSPTIPDELDLLAGTDLRSWLSDYYGSAAGQTPYPWKLENGELSCPQTVIRNAVPGRLKIENLIRYHRPMLEDGEIRYEFYYDPEVEVPDTTNSPTNVVRFGQPPRRTVPGKTVVHPALDRLVCLIEPDGVKVHWLTDGRYDRTGLLPGNVTLEPDRGPTSLPLLPDAWNRVQLAIAGDTLTIRLNDELVFTRPIEPTNLRQFGFFHFVNESDARVRNVVYRGNWPKTLPSPAEQELAGGPEQFAKFSDAELPARYDYDFRNSQFDRTKFTYHSWNAAAEFVHPSPEGLRIHMPAGQAKKTQFAGVRPKVRLSGDFEITTEFSGLNVVPPKESWGCGLSFKVSVEQSYDTGFEVRQFTTSNATRVVWQITAPPKQNLFFSETISDFPDSGRLRIARRGGVLYFLMAPLGSDDFRLLTQRPFGTNDVRAVNLYADASDQTAGSEVLFHNLSIRAASIAVLK